MGKNRERQGQPPPSGEVTQSGIRIEKSPETASLDNVREDYKSAVMDGEVYKLQFMREKLLAGLENELNRLENELSMATTSDDRAYFDGEIDAIQKEKVILEAKKQEETDVLAELANLRKELKP